MQATDWAPEHSDALREFLAKGQYRGGRAFQNDWEKAERGPQAVDPTREYVDGVQKREPLTEGPQGGVAAWPRRARAWRRRRGACA